MRRVDDDCGHQEHQDECDTVAERAAKAELQLVGLGFSGGTATDLTAIAAATVGLFVFGAAVILLLAVLSAEKASLVVRLFSVRHWRCWNADTHV